MKIALFDVDSTILNSMGAWENVGRRFLQNKGIETSKDFNNVLYPLTSMQAASYLKNYYQLEDSIQEILEAFHKDLHDYYVYDVQLKDGIIDVLDAFKKAEYHLYIATSSTRELVSQSFNRLNIQEYFSGVFTSDELRISKREPDFYKTISLKLNTDPSEIVVFEDNPEAAKAAKKLGMKVVGVYDKHCRGNLEENVDAYIVDWKELI